MEVEVEVAMKWKWKAKVKPTLRTEERRTIKNQKMNHDGVNFFFLVYTILGDSADGPITGAARAGLDCICHRVGPMGQVL